MAINGALLQNIATQFADELSTLFLSDPWGADARIDAFVRSQLPPMPVTPEKYYRECGDAFWRPQTCGFRDAQDQAFHEALSNYSASYYTVRKQVIDALIVSLNKQDKATLFEQSQRGQMKLVEQYNAMVAQVNEDGIIMQTINGFATSIPVIGTFVSLALKFKKEAKVDAALCTRISIVPREYAEKAGKNPDYLGLYFMYRTFNIFYEVQAEFERVKAETVGFSAKVGGTFISFTNPLVPILGALALVVVLIIILRRK